MNAPAWTWIGQIDCFGVKPARRDAFLQSWSQQAQDTHGDMQIRKTKDLLYTDRYDLHIEWTALAVPMPEICRQLLALLPADHPEMRLQGYDRCNLERMDIVMREGEVFVVPYVWQPAEAIPYRPVLEPESETAIA